jgi:hypothetical protein
VPASVFGHETMSGETDLSTLLQTLSPRLDPEHYVFCSVTGVGYGAFAHLNPRACFREDEGLTLVLTQAHASAEGLSYDGCFQCITLEAHSSLLAVGLTAALSTQLATAGISANIIAGFYHDHVFVPMDDALRAMAVLQAMAEISV